MIPIRREECSQMLTAEYKCGDREIGDFLGSLQFNSGRNSQSLRTFSKFCVFFVRAELTEVLLGKLTPEEAAGVIFAKWQRFRKQEEKNGIS